MFYKLRVQNEPDRNIHGPVVSRPSDERPAFRNLEAVIRYGRFRFVLDLCVVFNAARC